MDEKPRCACFGLEWRSRAGVRRKQDAVYATHLFIEGKQVENACATRHIIRKIGSCQKHVKNMASKLKKN
jgi:hypothetical protein